MLVSTRAATSVEILSSPSAVVRLRCGACRPALAVAFGRLVEPTELRFPILVRRLFTWRDQANRLTGRHPVYIVARTDMILVRDLPGHSDLVLGCDLSHTRFPQPLSLPEQGSDPCSTAKSFAAEVGPCP